LRRLEELSDMVKHTSLCGLGQSAPNPVLGSLRYFRDEYETKLKGNPSAVFEPVEEKPSSNSRPPAPGSRDSEILIDDQPVRLAKGQTLLEAAQSAGIHIPTLCHVDGLSDMAAKGNRNSAPPVSPWRKKE
jgi:hypothetical protein